MYWVSMSAKSEILVGVCSPATGSRIMAGHCPDAIPARELGDHSYFVYFIVDDIDDYHGTVVSHGAELIKPLRDEPWGMREFGVKTVDGHRIMIGQELKK